MWPEPYLPRTIASPSQGTMTGPTLKNTSLTTGESQEAVLFKHLWDGLILETTPIVDANLKMAPPVWPIMAGTTKTYSSFTMAWILLWTTRKATAFPTATVNAQSVKRRAKAAEDVRFELEYAKRRATGTIGANVAKTARAHPEHWRAAPVVTAALKRERVTTPVSGVSGMAVRARGPALWVSNKMKTAATAVRARDFVVGIAVGLVGAIATMKEAVCQEMYH
jgi:hypothetical protein